MIDQQTNSSQDFVNETNENIQTEQKINPAKLALFTQELESQQSLFGGLIAGLIAALVAALIWAGITAWTGYQIGWMSVGVGFLVGFAVRIFGRGVTSIFQLLGAALSLVGCLAGNIMTVALVFSRDDSMFSFADMMLLFATTPEAALEALKITFSPMDLLFYGIAIYQGYKLSLRGITEEEMRSLVD